MNIQKINLDRLSIVSNQSFDVVVGKLTAAIGRADLQKLANAGSDGTSYEEYGRLVRSLIMQQMASRVPDAASYAPVTILVDERPDGVHLSYDRMVSLLAPYGDQEALRVAASLDKKVETLLIAVVSRG
jgi:hypothetical protein